MKNLRKISAIFIALAMVLSVISSLSGVSVKAAGSTDVVIHKIVMEKTAMDAHFNSEKSKKFDGNQIGASDIGTYFGGNAKEVAGVAFDVYQRIDANETGALKNDNPIFGGVADTDTGKFFKKVQGPLITTANGITAAGLADGVYVIVENKAASTYTGANNEILSEAKAVPARLVLPATNSAGKTFGTGADALHIYPKNTEEKPKIDKTVGDLENKYMSTEIGKTVTWYLQATAPSDIKDYKKFILSDTFSNSLTYKGNVQVKFGTGTDFTTYTALTKDTDYTLTEAGQTVTIALKDAGIAKLAPGQKVIASVDTVINKDAVMGLEIPNNFTLEYGHDPNSTGKKEKLPKDEEPKVVTGGKKFKKVIEGTDTALEDAVFKLRDDQTDAKWTAELIEANKAAIDAGQFATENAGAYTATSATNQPTAGQPIYLRSKSDGTFEIKGLEFSSWKKQKWNGTAMVDGDQVTHKWNLVEVKAPTDYAINTTPVDFTVDKTSYFENPTIASPVAADPLKVNNKKVTIPQTGGIGTVIFAVVGLGLMGFAAYAMKRNSKED